MAIVSHHKFLRWFLRCNPLVVALAGADAETDGLTPSEQTLLRQACDGSEPSLAVRSRTRVDVGHWLGGGAVCAAVAGNELVLFAPGKRPYAERVSIPDALADSEYNHITAQLVLAPAEGVRVRRLRLSPVTGRTLWEQIQSKTKAGNHA
jgi:hypothetical protein